MSDFLHLRASTPTSIRHLDLTMRRNQKAATPNDGRRGQGVPLPVQKLRIMIMGFPVKLGRRRKAGPDMQVHRKKTYVLPDSSLASINPRSIDNRARTSR